ncbi:(2Fe-2S)-binding protein [Kineosporia rhizophila]|uniref:(2Fe-2S)-binding protein n=1 Tax=Kineosporia TaxID=49184 RepID=UPI001E642CD3|nr:(2Fe-2S)-binding protein [Kineosporia sp. NBRC 101677]MCE0536556.1 (2Fe-2S)-binding protein [Kineosporia rhizophila]GLY15348.1 proline dehydrogenase [Kineosporia sp. NBRC 101677]
MRGPRRLPAEQDPVRPKESAPLSITLDGEPVSGLQGQTIAGVLMGSGRLSWRRSPRTGRPRGVFCGIGVCFDCLVTVNDVPDVRACQRRAGEGDVVTSQSPQEPSHD